MAPCPNSAPTRNARTRATSCTPLFLVRNARISFGVAMFSWGAMGDGTSVTGGTRKRLSLMRHWRLPEPFCAPRESRTLALPFRLDLRPRLPSGGEVLVDAGCWRLRRERDGELSATDRAPSRAAAELDHNRILARPEERKTHAQTNHPRSNVCFEVYVERDLHIGLPIRPLKERTSLRAFRTICVLAYNL